MSFDLNINNYTKNELLDLFGLPLNYDKFSLEIKENKLKDKIIKSNEIDEDIKTQTINFIFKVKNILLNNLSDKPSLNGGEIIQEKVKELYNLSYQLKPTVLEDPQEHMVQVHHKTPYLSSYPSEYFPGVINPLKKKIIKLIHRLIKYLNHYLLHLSQHCYALTTAGSPMEHEYRTL